MQTRNLKHNADSTIDMEIEHPVYGWVPFTASHNDCEEHGKALYAAAIAGELGPVAPYIPPPEPTYAERLAAARASATLTPREFFLGLDAMGIYDTVMAAELPRAARIELETATHFDRTWPTLVEVAHSLGFTDEQLDALFNIEVTP